MGFVLIASPPAASALLPVGSPLSLGRSQQLENVQIATRHHQRGPSPFVRGVDIRPFTQQGLHDGRVTMMNGIA